MFTPSGRDEVTKLYTWTAFVATDSVIRFGDDEYIGHVAVALRESLLSAGREQFLRLPAPTRRALLAAAGRRAPWDPRFDHGSPPDPGELKVGPPDVVGIGAQKAGTTWWHTVLTGHPDFYAHPGVHKERHFFARFPNIEPTDADLTTYHRWFPRPAGRLTGEWTPDYLCQDWVPEQLHRAAPEAKLLVLLRDPVERYRSGLEADLEHGAHLTPAVAMEAFRRGLYSDDLARWESIWGRDRLFILQYERCCTDPAGELARTLRFLELDEKWLPRSLTVRINPTARSRTAAISGRRRRELAAAYAPDIARLALSHPDLDLTLWPSASLMSLA